MALRGFTLGAALVATVSWAGSARAQVVESGTNGFLVKSMVRIQAPSEGVYHALVEGVGAWWDSEHTFSGDARNLSIDARMGGCFCETLPNGGGVLHMTVILAEPPRRLRLAGALGPLQEYPVVGVMTWEIVDRDAETEVTLTYRVEGFRPGSLAELASPVGGVLEHQLARLKDHLEGP